MNKSDKQFILQTMQIERLLHDPSMDKTAQDFLSGVVSDIKNKVTGLKSVEDVLGFLVPGIFWTLGFKKLSLVYTVAEALGFNFSDFLSSIREKLKPILEDLFAGKQTEASTISNIVAQSASEATTDNVDPEKFQKAVTSSSLKNMLVIQGLILGLAKKARRSSSTLEEKIRELAQSTLGRRARSGVVGIIVRVFSWIITVILISLGLGVGGSVISNLVKSRSEETGETEGNKDQTITPASTQVPVPENEPNVKLYLNPQADQSLLTTTYNDSSHVWLLQLPITQIHELLIKWAQELYPNLNNKSAFESSSVFNRTLRMFKDRNKGSEQLNLIAVPQPFKSIKEIVDSFAADVASHM